MDQQEAKQLARQIDKIPSVRVLGTKMFRGERSLVIRLGRDRVAIRRDDRALFRVARLANVSGHLWYALDLCSRCGRKLVQRDGHYHEVSYGCAQPACCRCVGHRL